MEGAYGKLDRPGIPRLCVCVYVCVFCAQQAPGFLSHHPSSLLQPVTYHTQQASMLPFLMDSWCTCVHTRIDL